jgi:hypothetical protein
MRRSVLGVLLAVFVVGSVSAQAAAPRLVQSSDGTLYVIAGDVRHRIVPAPISDEELLAIGESVGWVDGTIALGTPAAPSQPVPQAAPAPGEQPITLSGSQDQNTAPFELRGGTYIARWSAQLRSGESSCFVGARVRRTMDQRSLDSIISTTLSRRQGAPSANGETILYGVTPGLYYLDVNTSGCDWSVTIAPQ